MSTTICHAAFRRQLNILRQSRLPHSAKRLQSTKSSSQTTSASSKTPINPSSTIPKPQETIPTPNTVSPVSVQQGFWQRLGPLTRAGEAYARTQRRRPYLTQTAATLVIYFLGDLTAQYIGREEPVVTSSTQKQDAKATTIAQATDIQEEKSFWTTQYDPIRTARSMTIGGAAAIPGWHWFLWLSSSFNLPSHIPFAFPLSILIKVGINQAVFTPIFNTYFFFSHSFLSGSTVEEAVERVKRAVPTSVVNSLKLWPAVTAFSFAFVPIEFRSLFAGGIAIGWQAYLSALNKRAERALREEMAVQGVEEKVVKETARAVEAEQQKQQQQHEEVREGMGMGMLVKIGLA